MTSITSKPRSGRAPRIAAAALAAALITAGATACTGGTPGPGPSAAPSTPIDLGDAPNQDVVALYTDRESAIAAALS